MNCTLDISDKQIANLDAYRSGSGLSRSQALESLLELCFPEATAEDLPDVGTVALVDGEASVLVNPEGPSEPSFGTVEALVPSQEPSEPTEPSSPQTPEPLPEEKPKKSSCK